jgi:Eco57I restriction-modification methylase
VAKTIDPPELFIKRVYEDLEYDKGDLLEASDVPIASNIDEWLNKGDWLSLAKRVQAERVFFVDNNPVIIFAKNHDRDPNLWMKYFNETWCMARPQLLFLAQPGELSVFDLSRPPIRFQDSEGPKERLLKIVKRAADVQAELANYHRSQIESGKLFEEKRFGDDNRADRALIKDLKIVRSKLIDNGLPAKYAHTLIGRSIFIRYLEDREILLGDYFSSLTEKNVRWKNSVNRAINNTDSYKHTLSIYSQILHEKSLVYMLFRKLQSDFNGDMFRLTSTEESIVKKKHLKILQDFLLCRIQGPSLFFFAYKFEIIPIELISSIYEEFYSTEHGKSENHGSYYTPYSLVEFLLTNTLDQDMLNTNPRILDPACGSGIFLVGAFRRIVRHKVSKLERCLRPLELKKILREQIMGIDISEEAIRVAALSLYLSLLHFLKESDILKNKRLPNLIYNSNNSKDNSDRCFNNLLPFNAFDIDPNIKHDSVRIKFSKNSFDVIVGNPPWGDAKNSDISNKPGGNLVLSWCKDNNKLIGDKELSQAFIHRSIDLLRNGGIIGLLVSTGVFFKQSSKSKQFRRQWLSAVKLKQVVNFALVRSVFFSFKDKTTKATSPFASIIFEKEQFDPSHCFSYWSAKRTAFIERSQCVLLTLSDLKTISQRSVMENDFLWKVYWLGGHKDEQLIKYLKLRNTLREIIGPDKPELKLIAQGFVVAKIKQKDSGWLKEYKVLPTKHFHRYGPIEDHWFEGSPSKVKNTSTKSIYEGDRILIKRGITSKKDKEQHRERGKIIARLESKPFCFRNSIHGIRLPEELKLDYNVLLGILWSSLSRYYLWMTCGSWGSWHDEIQKPYLENIPVCLPNNNEMRQRISNIVKQLNEFNSKEHGIFGDDYMLQHEIIKREKELEQELDQAVFDLYELSDTERDLVQDTCTMGIDLFYRGLNSDAIKPAYHQNSNTISYGRIQDLFSKTNELIEIIPYLGVFLEIWNYEIGAEGELTWQLISPKSNSPLLAVVFNLIGKNEKLPTVKTSHEKVWNDTLNQLSKQSRYSVGSKRIYIDGLVRIVTNQDIIIIKRNERRLWTKSAARDDAEATILKAIYLEKTTKGSKY